eukprot:CAMPEP_0202857124 /NCGR_PEP_ID=MMETSP1391-20130828/180_1 /ASSEMBLY_ACC=CAM_ASM_000867 /TAXON_ID=1034604 /ORGANISM="Chlamydomonas leiostraca, Strain SAG 11-49" /LENGTH=50 /DNA_ID=CAMNT_0049535883 /DNA_START=347 /DNA_END=499 /DNA_ORIENTATION=+
MRGSAGARLQRSTEACGSSANVVADGTMCGRQGACSGGGVVVAAVMLSGM